MTKRLTANQVNRPEITALQRELAEATERSRKLCEARANIAPGASRARVTSANAKWAQAAEYRDLLQRRLDELLEGETHGF